MSRAKLVILTALCGFGSACIEDVNLDLAAAEQHSGEIRTSGTTPSPGMVYVAAGSFKMGCNAAVDTACRPDEYPYHSIKLGAFEIDATEVTQAAYKACIDAGACTPPQANFDPTVAANAPVTDVSWYQASAYCAYAGKRLPTEAEWERAARGTDGRIFPWGNTQPTCTQANIAGCFLGPELVGQTTGTSPAGGQDMAGNVFEWVADWYSASYYSVSPSTSPTGPASGSFKVARGGSYVQQSWAARTATRIAGSPTLAYDDFGIRCARSR